MPSAEEWRRIERAIPLSFLAGVPSAIRARLLERGRLIRVRPTEVVADSDDDFAGIVVSGLLRVHSAVSGRIVTLRNVAHGEAVGLGAMIGVRSIALQAVTVSEVFVLDVRTIAQLRTSEAALSLALASEAVRRLADTAREVALWSHGSTNQRLARQLLDLAAEVGAGDPPTIRVTHQEIADAIDVRRETVTRALGSLEVAGAVRLLRGTIIIDDPHRLRSVAAATSHG